VVFDREEGFGRDTGGAPVRPVEGLLRFAIGTPCGMTILLVDEPTRSLFRLAKALQGEAFTTRDYPVHTFTFLLTEEVAREAGPYRPKDPVERVMDVMAKDVEGYRQRARLLIRRVEE